MEAATPAPHRLVLGGCPKEGVAASHCSPRTSGGCSATPPAHTQPRSTRPAWPQCVTPNRLDEVQGWGIPWPEEPVAADRSCYNLERAEAKNGRTETGTGSRPTSAAGTRS